MFSLKPISHNVGDFVDMLKFEDKGIDSVFIKNMDGVRIASKTSIQTLFEQVIVHREGEDIEMFLFESSMFYVFLFVGLTTLGTFIEFDWLAH